MKKIRNFINTKAQLPQQGHVIDNYQTAIVVERE